MTPLEVPKELLATDGLMKFYNCSDFPFNFNFIVDLTIMTLLDNLTGFTQDIEIIFNYDADILRQLYTQCCL